MVGASQLSDTGRGCSSVCRKREIRGLPLALPQLHVSSSNNCLRSQPLVLEAWGVVLEMAWVEPAWAAHLLKRRRWKRHRKKAQFLSGSLSGPSPLAPTPGRGRLCRSGCVQVRSGTQRGGWCDRWVTWGERMSAVSSPLGPSFGLCSAELAAPGPRGGVQSAQAALSWWCQEAWAAGCPWSPAHFLSPEVPLCFRMELGDQEAQVRNPRGRG